MTSKADAKPVIPIQGIDKNWIPVHKKGGIRYALAYQSPQYYVAETQNSYRHIDVPVNSSTEGTMFQSKKTINLKLDKGSFKRLRSLAIRFKLDVTSAAVTPATMPFWFHEIGLSLNNGTDFVQMYYPETLEMMLAMKPLEERLAMKSLMGYGPHDSWFPKSTELGASIPSGNSRYYTLPLPNTFLEKCGVDSDILGENGVTIRLVTRESGILTSGTAANVAVSEIKFVIQDSLDDSKRAEAQSNWLQTVDRFAYYINCYKITGTFASTLTTANATKVSLGAIPSGVLSPLVLVSLRKSSTTDEPMSGFNVYTLIDGIGPEPSRLTLLKNDTSMLEPAKTISPNQAFRQLVSKYIGSDFLSKKNIYALMPGDAKEAINYGRFSQSWFDFTNPQSNWLEFTPISRTNYVETVTLSAAPTVGSYCLQYDGQLSEPLAYNANAAAILAAVDAMESIRRDNLVVTFSAALSAGATPTITFTGSGRPRGLIKVIPLATLLATATPVTATHAWTTIPENNEYPGGITTATAYLADIFVFYYANFSVAGKTGKFAYGAEVDM